jgi:hypothetical protein
MRQPPLDPDAADEAPVADMLTPYDQEHLVTYLRLLDAQVDRVDWKEAARAILHIDPDREPARARLSWESHMRRAHWMTEEGYRHLLRLSQLH